MGNNISRIAGKNKFASRISVILYNMENNEWLCPYVNFYSELFLDKIFEINYSLREKWKEFLENGEISLFDDIFLSEKNLRSLDMKVASKNLKIHFSRYKKEIPNLSLVNDILCKSRSNILDNCKYEKIVGFIGKFLSSDSFIEYDFEYEGHRYRITLDNSFQTAMDLFSFGLPKTIENCKKSYEYLFSSPSKIVIKRKEINENFPNFVIFRKITNLVTSASSTDYILSEISWIEEGGIYSRVKGPSVCILSPGLSLNFSDTQEMKKHIELVEKSIGTNQDKNTYRLGWYYKGKNIPYSLIEKICDNPFDISEEELTVILTIM